MHVTSRVRWPRCHLRVGTVSGYFVFDFLLVFRRVPDAVVSQGRPGQGVNGFPTVGKDYRKRNVVKASPVRRAVARAGQANVLAVNTIPLAVVQIFHQPVTAI